MPSRLVFFLCLTPNLLQLPWLGLGRGPKLKAVKVTCHYVLFSFVPFPPAVLDWECPKLEGHVQCKNSTLLDTSKAVAIEKAPQFSNLSSILGEFSRAFFSYHREFSYLISHLITWLRWCLLVFSTVMLLVSLYS